MSITGPRSYCPINLSLELFGDAWTLLVLRDIMFAGKRHFRELMQSDERISSNILADRARPSDEVRRSHAQAEGDLLAHRESHRPAPRHRAGRRLGLPLGSRRQEARRPRPQTASRDPRRRPAHLGHPDGRAASAALAVRATLAAIARDAREWTRGAKAQAAMRRTGLMVRPASLSSIARFTSSNG
jgi:hypothetical protein